jgi:hypothetical protein
MDRTHLRWFTPESYRELLEQAGVSVQEMRRVAPKTLKARLIEGLTGGRFAHLFIGQMFLVGRKPA